ncbi:FIST C-terminal domain-containing protein [Candidatus Parcubacteria bacterium]|nr:FIST C-terminal domain-containing protein [Candidatus Parcubacteria bacterium]
MITAKTGISNNQDAFEAGKDAAQQAKEEMAGVEPQLILVRASSSYEQPKILAGIDSVFPDVPLAGGSPLGGVITEKGLEDQGVAIMALKFEKAKFATACVEGLSNENLVEKGIKLGEELLEKCEEEPKLVMLFLSPAEKENQMFDINMFLEGLKKKLKNSSIIGGGGISEEFFKSGKVLPGFEFYNKEVKQHSIVAVGFWGDFSFSAVSGHGWEPIGLEMKVTKTKPGLIQEIDGKPAIEVFEKYLEKTKEEILNPEFFTKEGTFYPFGIVSENSQKVIVKAIVGATPAGELILFTPISEGATIRILQVQTDKMVETAKEVTEDAMTQLDGKSPELAFLFSCTIRKGLLMPDQGRESKAVIEKIGKDIPLFGSWNAGEICSRKEEEEWMLHNETIVVGLMSE